MPTALSRHSRRTIRVGGTLLCMIAIALLARRGYQLGSTLGDGLARIGAVAFVEATTAYAAGAALLGVSWVWLARAATGRHLAGMPLYAAHLQSQLAKYLPGNVFHLAYRHLAARRAGIGHAPLALALGAESLLIVAAGSALALGVVADPRIAALVPHAHAIVWSGLLLPLMTWLGMAILLRRAGSAGALRLLPAAAVSVAIDLAFLALASIALRHLCPTPEALSFTGWCGWLAAAWLLGYVVPGAPAGIGVREAVLALGLGPVLGDAEALVVALAYRLVTVLADALLAAFGFLLRERA